MCYNRENKDKRFIMTKLYGSLEAGGTKFVCAVGDENFNVVEKTQFPTTTPIETIDKTIEFFSKFDNLAGLAVGSFGPIDIDKNSKTYGFITTTPKPHWANVDLLGALRRALNVLRGENIELNSSVWDVQAYYIAQAAVNATVTFRPDVIVFGGGVMAQQHMLDRVREKFTALLNGYLPVPDVRDYIVTPAVAGNGSATLGNFVLAKSVAK